MEEITIDFVDNNDPHWLYGGIRANADPDTHPDPDTDHRLMRLIVHVR